MDLEITLQNFNHHEIMYRAQDSGPVALRSRSLLEDIGKNSLFFFRVRSITLSFLDGFRNYIEEMLTILRRRVANKT